jgi:hypothetical protein
MHCNVVERALHAVLVGEAEGYDIELQLAHRSKHQIVVAERTK